MRVLFARVGYMKFYRGSTPGDERPIGGGKYNKDHVGHELYNFKDIDGTTYGYFQPSMKSPREVKLSRIDPKIKGEEAEDVLVIWFAKNPVGKGQIIVGWYQKSTVYRTIRGKGRIKERGGYDYLVEAKTKNCVLLPLKQRQFLLGHRSKVSRKGNPGQANVFYLYDATGKIRDLESRSSTWIKKAIDYVLQYDGPRLTDASDDAAEEALTAATTGSGQGFGDDIRVRKWVEDHAMRRVTAYYQRRGYTVTDVSASRSYDLHVVKRGQSLLVEVKGTRSADAGYVLLTRNEVELSRDRRNHTVLAIVSAIEVGKTRAKKGSGELAIIDPWRVDQHSLQPTAYCCKLGSTSRARR